MAKVNQSNRINSIVMFYGLNNVLIDIEIFKDRTSREVFSVAHAIEENNTNITDWTSKEFTDLELRHDGKCWNLDVNIDIMSIGLSDSLADKLKQNGVEVYSA
jgi:hypothetical protein